MRSIVRSIYNHSKENPDKIAIIASDMEVSSQVREPVIEEMCRDAADDVLTPEEIEWWDSMNASGATLIVRGAERELDTTVNHMHYKFITDP